MIIAAVTAIVFGAGFAIAPVQLSSLFDISPTATSDFAFRLYGTALIGIGLLGWLVRESTDRDIQKPTLTALFVTDFGGFLVVFFAQLAGLMNALGWSIAILLLLLSAADAYLYFSSK
jgi:hypothetical protein